jgi:hypothetical protein
MEAKRDLGFIAFSFLEMKKGFKSYRHRVLIAESGFHPPPCRWINNIFSKEHALDASSDANV